jgi:hypothetical protein
VYAAAEPRANATCRGHAAAVADVDDEREADEGQRERKPDAPAHALVEDVPRRERDGERGDVLDQERDPDCESVEREEVEPLHEGEAADPPHDEERKLAPPHLQPLGRDHEEHDHEPDDRSRHPHLCEPQRRDPGCEDHLRDRAVDGPESGGGRRHHVADARTPARRRGDGKGGFGHPL